MESNRNRNLLIIGVAVVVLFFCVGSFTVTAAVGYYLFMRGDGDSSAIQINVPAATPRPEKFPTPTPLNPGHKPEENKPEATPVPGGGAVGAPASLTDTERQLAEVIVPTRDLRDLALRLRPDVDDVPLVVNEQPPRYQVGDRLDFWVSNVDNNEQFQITAELVYMTDVAYVWVETGNDYDKERISESVDRFSAKSYPTVREFFGSEWSPGVDNDPRLHILHANNLGRSIAGYYSSADEFSRLANEFSNEKEMFYISLEWLNRSRDYEYYETVLAHEFQHMVHWYNDRNEETWVNEGLSELAQEVAGYPPDTGFASVFASVPDTQLNTWSDDPAGNGEHYGSAYLFMAYILQRFGEDLTKAVVAHPANGITGVSAALEEAGYAQRFVDVFADWLVANYVDDPDALGQKNVYGYRQLRAPKPDVEKTYRRYPIDTRRTSVYNFGADYLELAGSGDVTLHFQGATETRLANAEAYSGQLMWWSNRADDSDSRLTRRFDFSGVQPGEALTMDVAMWYDIEDDYDYGYVLVSRDGKKWDILPGQHTTTENPSGNSFGHAYTAESSTRGDEVPEWLVESFDLGAYAGEEVWVRFEYVTDDAVNYPGWFIDDIRIPTIGYATDFENGPDGWESEGWLLTDNRLPQRWLVQVLAFRGDELVGVQRVPVAADGTAQVEVNGLGGRNRALVIISGTTPVTTEPADYTYRIDAR